MNMLAGLQRLAERRLPALTRMRTPESLPITLHRRRIYIVPTAFGIGMAVLLMVMLVGALNYANNAALLLTCLLGGALANSMLLTYRALDGFSLQSVTAAPVHAGDALEVRLHVDAGGRTRHGLRVDGEGLAPQAFGAEGGADTDVPLTLATDHRGWMDLPHLRIASTWPFGVFRAWSWLAPQVRILVYPRLEAAGPSPRAEADEGSQRRRRQGEETAALREYRVGDPRKLVAWKASARHQDLLVRDAETASPQPSPVLDWHALHGMDRERRISRLARWVAESSAAGRAWTLRLERETLGPARGEAHYHRCMRALAELP